MDCGLQTSSPSGREHDDEEDPRGDRARDQAAGNGAAEVGPRRPQASGLRSLVRAADHRQVLLSLYLKVLLFIQCCFFFANVLIRSRMMFLKI